MPATMWMIRRIDQVLLENHYRFLDINDAMIFQSSDTNSYQSTVALSIGYHFYR